MAAAVAMALTASVAGVTMAPATAAAGPDLVVTTVAKPPASVVRGQSIAIKAVVKNAGTRASAASTVRFVLSKDTRLGRDDRKLADRSVKRLLPRRAVTISATVKVAAATPTGRYHVLACADATKKVREIREGNNCRASLSRVLVKAPTAPTPPPPPPPAGSGPGQAILDKLTDSGDAFWLPAQPGAGRTAAVTTDDARAVTKRIDETGGSLEVTTAAGDVITLTVPARALTGGVTITATPVTSLAGTDAVGGTPIGLSLAPEGLTFLEPARMTVLPATGGAAQSAIAVTGYGDGSGTRPGLLLPDPTRLEVVVPHFSTATVVLGDAAAVKGYFSPAEYQADIASQIAEIINDAREQGLATGETPDFSAQVAALFESYYTNVLAPRLPQVSTGCQAAEQWTPTLLSYERQLQLLGLPSPHSAQIMAAILAGARACLDEAAAPCMVMDARRYSRWLAYNRVLQLLGVPAEEIPPLTWCSRMNGYMEIKRDFTNRLTQPNGYDDHSVVTVWVSTDALVQWSGDRPFSVGNLFGDAAVDRSSYQVRATEYFENNIVYTDGTTCRSTDEASVSSAAELREEPLRFSIVLAEGLEGGWIATDHHFTPGAPGVLTDSCAGTFESDPISFWESDTFGPDNAQWSWDAASQEIRLAFSSVGESTEHRHSMVATAALHLSEQGVG